MRGKSFGMGLRVKNRPIPRYARDNEVRLRTTSSRRAFTITPTKDGKFASVKDAFGPRQLVLLARQLVVASTDGA